MRLGPERQVANQLSPQHTTDIRSLRCSHVNTNRTALYAFYIQVPKKLGGGSSAPGQEIETVRRLESLMAQPSSGSAQSYGSASYSSASYGSAPSYGSALTYEPSPTEYPSPTEPSQQVLAYGISEGCLAVNVASSVKAPRKQHGDGKPKIVWGPQELVQFRTVADQDDWAAAWRLTLYGLRRSEVLGLQWTVVDLIKGEIKIEAGRVLLDKMRTATDDPKSTASHRTVLVEDMHPGTVALLRSLKARQAADLLVLGAGYRETGYVLVDPLGEPVKPYTYSDHFEILCRKAGVPVVQLHSVRHTLATPSDAAALLGHTVTVHLARYVTPTQKGARTAASGLGAAISGLG